MLDRIVAGHEHDRNRRGRRLGRECCRGSPPATITATLAANQIGRQRRQPIKSILCPAVFDRNVLTFDIAGFIQASAECRQQVC